MGNIFCPGEKSLGETKPSQDMPESMALLVPSASPPQEQEPRTSTKAGYLKWGQ